MSDNTRWLVDMAERTARTFVQGFLAVVTLDAFMASFDPSWDEKLLAGALAGVYAVLTSFVAKPVGASDSASLLPADVDPPQNDLTVGNPPTD